MAIYSLAQRSTVTTIAAASHAFLAPATNKPSLLEWGYVNGAATACVVGLGRTANTPTLTGGVAFLAEEFFRRFSMAALVGAGIAYSFPWGITIPAGGQAMCAWNITASSAVVDIYAVVNE